MICLHLNILSFPQFQFESPHHQFSKRTCSEFFKDFKEFTSLETAESYFIHSGFSSFFLFWIFYEIYSQDFFLLYRINFYIALMEKSYFQLSVMMLLFHFKYRRSTDYPTEYSAVVSQLTWFVPVPHFSSWRHKALKFCPFVRIHNKWPLVTS